MDEQEIHQKALKCRFPQGISSLVCKNMFFYLDYMFFIYYICNLNFKISLSSTIGHLRYYFLRSW